MGVWCKALCCCYADNEPCSDRCISAWIRWLAVSVYVWGRCYQVLPVRAMWAKTALVTGLRLRKRQLAVAGTTATVLTIADKYPMSC